mgnify:CR=1 FL=1
MYVYKWFHKSFERKEFGLNFGEDLKEKCAHHAAKDVYLESECA